MNKKCVNCGKKFEKGAQICPFCGAAQEDVFGNWRGTSYGSDTADDLRWNDLGQKRAAQRAQKKRKGRITAAIVLGCVIALVAAMFLVVYFAQFKCGDNAKWKLDDGTLTISGEGEMYSSWGCEFRDRSGEIEKVVIEDGITSIGYEAFKGFEKLKSIEIADSVTEVSYNVFEGCSSLTQVKLSENCTKIAYEMFKNCSSLESVEIPDCVTSVGSGAFEGCSSIVSITIPDSVTEIDSNAFWGCQGLEKVIFESFDVWENMNVSDSGNGSLDGHIYFADGTRLIQNAALQTGDEYSIADETGRSGGLWKVFDDNEVYNCLSFDLELRLSEVSEGDPYGTFDIYILKSDGSYEMASSMNVTDTSAVTKRVQFEQVQSVKGVTVIPRAAGNLKYSYYIQISNLIEED